MKKIIVVFLFGNICACYATTDSLLTATQFPKTFEDLSFKSRMDVLREGYIPFEVVYDENGVCISGCAYRGITIKEDMIAVDEANEQMADLIENADDFITDENQNASTSTSTDFTEYQSDYNPSAKDWCHNGLSTKLPLRYPVDMTNFKYKITSDFGFRKIKESSSSFHPALDIGTPISTPVYATADGVVETVSRQDSPGGGGLFINIKHDRGFITQYIHLNQAFVKPGDRVRACDKIAESGNSGKSANGGSYGPHLDYRIRFNTNKNNFVDILCPCKATNRNTHNSTDNYLDMSCVHSLFNAPYKFVPYNPNSNDTKRSIWRTEHGHCMRNVYDLLPDEVK